MADEFVQKILNEARTHCQWMRTKIKKNKREIAKETFIKLKSLLINDMLSADRCDSDRVAFGGEFTSKQKKIKTQTMWDD